MFKMLRDFEARIRVFLYLDLMKRNEKVGVNNLGNKPKYYTRLFLGEPKNSNVAHMRVRILEPSEQDNKLYPRVIKVKNLSHQSALGTYSYYDWRTLANLSIRDTMLIW